MLSKADLLQAPLAEADRLVAGETEASASASASEPVSTAVDWLLAVPDALRVSSVSGSGVEELRAALEGLAEAWLAAHRAEPSECDAQS